MAGGNPKPLYFSAAYLAYQFLLYCEYANMWYQSLLQAILLSIKFVIILNMPEYVLFLFLFVHILSNFVAVKFFTNKPTLCRKSRPTLKNQVGPVDP
jgi:hypothetical protein